MVPLMLLIGIVQIAGYYLMSTTIRSDGGFAVPQPDTLLYCQAARRIAEGHAFSFSAGSVASSGTTSVLYPFLLAVPYLLGAAGDSLLRAGFALNASFYLVFLCIWARIYLALFSERSISLATASLLTALFGPFAFCALSQSDTGFWMAISAGIVWGVISGKRRVYVPLLLIAPWVRPEGMMIVASWAVFSVVRLIMGWTKKLDLSRRDAFVECFLSVIGVTSVAGVFFLNYCLTGVAQFSSIANKGYFTQLPFFQAVYASAVDGVLLAKAYLFGIAASSPRDLMFVPIAGAAFMWLGVFVRLRKGLSWRFWMLVTAIMVGFYSVATSGWQDTNLDRYLAWTWPVALLFIAEGCGFVAERTEKIGWSFLPSVILVAFSAMASFVLLGVYRVASETADRRREFAVQCEKVMAPKSAIGVLGSCGIAYEFSPRRMAHLSGIYSPEFRTKTVVASIEILKNEPETRFEYFLHDSKNSAPAWGGVLDVLTPNQVLVGPDMLELRQADWSPLEAASRVPPSPKAGLELVDKIDVGYERDEKSHFYECLTFYNMPLFAPFTIADKLDGQNVVDGGRLAFGGDEMTVRTEPGKDLYVIMRTYPSKTVRYERNISSSPFCFEQKTSIQLEVKVDGVSAVTPSIGIATNGFSDVSFVVPGSAIQTDRPRLSFEGSHITCGYWFFQ